MKWTILNTLICPQSGIAFSAISSLRCLKFIMWYEADVILLPGESIRLYSSRVLINDQYHSLKIYNITVYDEAQWEKLRERPSCPYHAGSSGLTPFTSPFARLSVARIIFPAVNPGVSQSTPPVRHRRRDVISRPGRPVEAGRLRSQPHEVASPQARIGEKRIARSARLLNQ